MGWRHRMGIRALCWGAALYRCGPVAALQMCTIILPWEGAGQGVRRRGRGVGRLRVLGGSAALLCCGLMVTLRVFATILPREEAAQRPAGGGGRGLGV